MIDPTHTGDSRERRIRDRRKREGCACMRHSPVIEANPTCTTTSRRPDSDRRKAPQAGCQNSHSYFTVERDGKWVSICAICGFVATPSAPTPVQPAGATNQDWMAAISRAMGADEEGSVWTPGEVEDILRDALKTARERSDLLDKSERVLAASSVPVPATPVTEQDAREWLDEFGPKWREQHKRDSGQIAANRLTRQFVIDALAAFANRTAPAREGK